jgi:hypothetical protein
MFDKSGSWLSPHYLHDQIDLKAASIEDRIAILEDRLRGYYTTPARLLSNLYENSMLIILLAIFSCVELIESFHQGKSSNRKSKPYFKSGFRRIFNPTAPQSIPLERYEANLDKALDEIYLQARCGLMHVGVTRSKVMIDKGLEAPVAIQFDGKKDEVLAIVFNPNRSLLALDVFLSDYFRELRNPDNENLRDNFDRAWKALADEG